MTRNPAPSFRKQPAIKSAGIILLFRKTFLWVLIIVVLSFLPGKTFEKVKFFDFSFRDLVVHFIMYGVFTVFLIKEWLSAGNRPGLLRIRQAAWIIPLLASLVLSLVTETIQHFWIPGRFGSLADGIMNMLGSAAAILVCRIRVINDRLKG